MAGLGAGLGLLGPLALTRALASLLYGVSARRAMQVDPIVALRYERDGLASIDFQQANRRFSEPSAVAAV